MAGGFAAGTAPAACKEIEGKLVDNLSNELGFPLYSWAPEQPPRAVLVAIHGATLHGRSYTKIGEILAKKGYAVFAPDMRGFGAWYHNSKPDDETLARHVLYRQSETDLKTLLNKVHALYPGKPVFLMGESVGANMAIRLLATEPNCADGMVLSSPAVRQRLFFGPTVVLQALTVFFWSPGAQLDITPYLRTRVSEDERITEERVNDPLARNKLNVGELFKTRWFNKDSMKLLPLVPKRVAVLVLEGSEDKLFDAQDVDKMISMMPCQDKTLHVLKGKGHIHLETQFVQDEVETTLESWLSEKSSKFAQEKKNETASAPLESARVGSSP